MKTALSLILWWLALKSVSAASPPVIPEDVQATVRLRVNHGYCPSIVVGVRNTNGVNYYSFGQTELVNGHDPDENTLYEIGSITKVFTATVLADMAENGQLSLDDSIQTLLPVNVEAPTRSGKSITLTHLATHTSGLPSTPANLSPTDGNNPFADYTVENMYSFLQSYSLPRDPGERYEYSNYGVGLLGHLLALKAGSPYENLVVQRIANELELADTRITLTSEQRMRLAGGYSGVVPVAEFKMASLDGSGALRSSAKDMLEFLAAHRGWRSTRLLPAMTIMQQRRYSTPSPGLGVGLGWHLVTLGTGTAIMHDGATIGHRAFTGFLQNGTTLVVVLSNSDYDNSDIGFHLLNPSFPLKAVQTPRMLPLETLQRYVGRYQGTSDDSFMIGLLQGRLTLQYSGDLGRTLTLYPSGENRFYLVFPTAQGTFTTNGTGQATALVWNQAGVSLTYSKVAQPSRLALQQADGAVHLHLSGDTGRAYVIQASTNLVQWSSISTNTIWENPIVDPSVSVFERRFYRVLEPL